MLTTYINEYKWNKKCFIGYRLQRKKRLAYWRHWKLKLSNWSFWNLEMNLKAEKLEFGHWYGVLRTGALGWPWIVLSISVVQLFLPRNWAHLGSEKMVRLLYYFWWLKIFVDVPPLMAAICSFQQVFTRNASYFTSLVLFTHQLYSAETCFFGAHGTSDLVFQGTCTLNPRNMLNITRWCFETPVSDTCH